jgi:hypothetical protein
VNLTSRAIAKQISGDEVRRAFLPDHTVSIGNGELGNNNNTNNSTGTSNSNSNSMPTTASLAHDDAFSVRSRLRQKLSERKRLDSVITATSPSSSAIKVTTPTTTSTSSKSTSSSVATADERSIDQLVAEINGASSKKKKNNSKKEQQQQQSKHKKKSSNGGNKQQQQQAKETSDVPQSEDDPISSSTSSSSSSSSSSFETAALYSSLQSCASTPSDSAIGDQLSSTITNTNDDAFDAEVEEFRKRLEQAESEGVSAHIERKKRMERNQSYFPHFFFFFF